MDNAVAMSKYKKIAFWVCGGILMIVCAVIVISHAQRITSNMRNNMTSDVQSTQDDALNRYKMMVCARQKENADEQDTVAQNQSQTTAEIAQSTPEADTIQNVNPFITQDESGAPVYMVQKGDTLSKVSARVFYSVDELAEYNKIKDVNLIYADSALRVPIGE